MFCSNCGKELKEGEKFCSECGNQINYQTSNTESKKYINKNEIVTNNVAQKMQCKIHNKDSISICKKCGNTICEDCDSILNEIEDHSYLHEKFSNIGKNLCLDCTLKELSINHFWEDKSLEFKLITALIISYIIGLLIFIAAQSDGSIIGTIIGLFIMGIVPGAKAAMFWDSTDSKSSTKKYDVSYTGFGTYQVRENNGGGLFFLIGLLSGIIVSPIFIIKGISKYIIANRIYKFNEYIKRKIEDLLKKIYVRDYDKNTLYVREYTEEGKRPENPNADLSFMKHIIIAILIFILVTILISLAAGILIAL